MPNALAKLYSWADGVKRRVSNPLQTIGMGLVRGAEDLQQAGNDMDIAYGRGGMNSVLIPPEQRAEAARRAAEYGTNMAMGAATVWHGSPHKFDKFDSSKIGTGEGAQAYGHGLYLAESPEVAAGYRDKLSKSVTVDGKKLASIPSDGPMGEAHNMVVRAIQDGMTPQQAIAHTKKYWMNAADEMAAFKQSNPELAARIDSEVASRRAVAAATDSMRPESFFKDPGSLYKVDLPDNAIARMLDWDKPLSQQAPEVQKWAKEMVNKPGDPYNLQRFFNPKNPNGGPLGAELYGAINDPSNAAALLRQQGIPGIRYLDGGSRGAGQGSSNFVVFPGQEDILTILERNGVPIR